MAEHPITPPPELVGQWLTEAADLQLLTPSNLTHLATQAARWGADQQLKLDVEQITQAYQKGADQELEECCDAVYSYEGSPMYGGTAEWLRAARRPKPPSLKEQALHILDTHGPLTPAEADTIRRALEALDD